MYFFIFCTSKYFLSLWFLHLKSLGVEGHIYQSNCLILIVKYLIYSLCCFYPMIYFWWPLCYLASPRLYFDRLSTLLSSVTKWEFSEVLLLGNFSPRIVIDIVLHFRDITVEHFSSFLLWFRPSRVLNTSHEL